MARPRSTFKDEYVEETRALCERGATDVDLAAYFQTTTRTIQRWRLANPEFDKACRAGKGLVDERVERTLLERALGYSYPSEKVFCNKDGFVTRVKTLEHVPPDIVACIFWLKNRRPADWRDVKNVNLEGAVAVQHLGLQEVRERTEYLLGERADPVAATPLLQ